MIDDLDYNERHLRVIDWCRWIVLVGLGATLAFTYPKSEVQQVVKPVDGQPWITSPRPGAVVKAGKLDFSGTGPTGTKIEIVEDGRIVADAWVDRTGTWKTVGKLFKGPVHAFVRVVGGKQSPTWTYEVDGTDVPTLSITSPEEGEDLGPKKGKVVVKGRGKPDDEILLSFAGKAIAKVKVNAAGEWSKEVKVIPIASGFFKAFSRAETETAVVNTTGPD